MKKIGNALFFLTFISPMVSFALASEIGEVDVFGVAGIIRYSWVMWFFVPIGLLSLMIGIKLKKNKQNYKKNIVIAFICVPIILIFGSYRFIFDTISYDVNKVIDVESQINIDLPNKIKIATNDLGPYNVSYVKILDEGSKEKFEHQLQSTQMWKNKLTPNIKGLLPANVQYETVAFEYFLFYNVTIDEYNIYPPEGEWNVYLWHMIVICRGFSYWMVIE